MKKIIKRLFSISIFILLIFFLSSSFDENTLSQKKASHLSAESWKSELVEINSENNNSFLTNYVSIKSLISCDVSGLVISAIDPNSLDNKQIIKIVDGLDLYYFSEICNPKFANGTINKFYNIYLTKNYILGADINYEDASQTFKLFRPIGWGDNSFSGSFDGKGFEVSNLFMKPLDDLDEYINYYNCELSYFAMFSQNEGVIKNVGIISPNIIQYDSYESLVFASAFIGLNKGTVENCFVQDLRKDGAGLSCEGNYVTSMFVNSNVGTISNSYVACSRIISPSVVISSTKDRHPFINQNNGTLSNCYFDKTILTGQNTYNQSEYAGLTPLRTAEFTNTSGENYFNYDNKKWFSNATYEASFSSYLNLTYPILKGFNKKEVNDKEYFLINSCTDLIYFSQLISKYQPFRQASYILDNSINMDEVKEGSYVFSNAVFSGELIGGEKNNTIDVYLNNGIRSSNNAIVNFKVSTGVSYNGYHAYGLFSIFRGTIKNIDLVNVQINQDDLTSTNLNEKNVIGSVCGLQEGGLIEGVNVLTDINLSCKNASEFLGTTLAGGICGYSTSGKIYDCTTSGKIYNQVIDISSGNEYYFAIGGIVGEISYNEEVKNCLNSIKVQAFRYKSNPSNNFRQYIGGVIGKGKINNASLLQNNGDIYCGSTTDDTDVNNSYYYGIVYLGGVIGLLSDVKNESGKVLNNANLKYYANDNNLKAYISGACNIISPYAQSIDTFDQVTSISQNELNNQGPYELISIASTGSLCIINNCTKSYGTKKMNVVSGIEDTDIDLRVAGVIYSYLTNLKLNGVYNYDYHFEWEHSTLRKKANGPQEVDISIIDEYAPCINADNLIACLNKKIHLDTNQQLSKSNTIKFDTPRFNSSINVKRCYNFNGVNYITTKEVKFFMLQLSGCINGRNINADNVRNDGDIKVYFTKTTTSVKMDNSYYINYYGEYKKLKLYGCLEEISNGYRAQNIYNGGNITISSNNQSSITMVNFNLFISGICYKNAGNDDPGEELMMPSGYVGSLHNAVNNGNIRVTNGDILTDNPTAGGNFYGLSRIGGISVINSSTISSSLNLGDIYNINYNYTRNQTGGSYIANFEIETGGFCFCMQNEKLDNNGNYTKANIIDSANNGKIVSVNTNNEKESWVNAGGFIVRNDRDEAGEKIYDAGTVTKEPHKEKILYSINYGDLYAYNSYNDEDETSSSEPQCKVAGFICLGVCSIIDVINYGKISGSKVAGGMFGFIFEDNFKQVGLSKTNPVYIANAINYGAVGLVNVNIDNINKLYNITSETNLTLRNVNTTSTNSTHYPIGALIGMVRGNNQSDDLTSLNIKNLINFYDNVDIVGRTYKMVTPSTSDIQATLQYAATTKEKDYSPSPFSTSTIRVKSYYKDIRPQDQSVSDIYSRDYNGGIFNQNYALRNTPSLTYTEDGKVDSNNTDNFIADYIQFIPYSKVNDYLVEKILLDEVVMDNALNNAINDYITINGLINYTYNNESDSDNLYDILIVSNGYKLNTYKTQIVNKIKELIKSNNCSIDEAYQILGLLNNNEIFEEIINDENVQAILVKYINNMDSEYISNFLENIFEDNEKIKIILLKNPDIFSLYLNNYFSNENINPDNLYSLLVNDEDILNNYIENLSKQEKSNLANQIYNILSDNNLIDDVINNSIFNNLSNFINIDNEEKLSDFKALISDENTDENKRNEFIIPYLINSLNNASIRNLMIKLNDNYSSIGDLFESGRSNTEGIYLPASKANYINKVNSSNFVINTSFNENFSSNSYFYTGTHYDYNNQYYSSHENGDCKQIYVITGNAYRSGWIRYYYYWKLSETSFTFDRSISSSTNDRYNIYFLDKGNDANVSSSYNQQSNKENNLIESGVFANYSKTTKDSYTDYSFTNVKIYKYIDYGTGANQQNGLDLTEYMLRVMESLDYTDNNSLTKVKSYLIEIYNNRVGNEFNQQINNYANLLFESIGITTDNEKLNFIKTKLTTDNANDFINCLTDDNDKLNLIDNYGDYTFILDYLLIKISNINSIGDLQNIKTQITPNIIKFSKYGSNETLNSISNIINNIFSGDSGILISLANNEKKILLSNLMSSQGSLFLNYLLEQEQLNKNEIGEIIKAILMTENGFTKLKTELKNMPDEVNNILSSYMIMGDRSLFIEKLLQPNDVDENDLDELITLLNNANIDLANVTDTSGIYALASSYGVDNGLFIPDNVKLIDLDIYEIDENGNETSSSLWRGGTLENPDEYSTEGSVNYKIYYTMKQLKLSIATMVFRMELVDSTIDEDGVQLPYTYVISNDSSTYQIGESFVCDYDLINKEIHYYVPINASILKQDMIYANMDRKSYELSYHASFDYLNNNLAITIPDNIYVGQELSDEFIIQAEDKRVKTTYKAIIHITNPLYLDNLTVNDSTYNLDIDRKLINENYISNGIYKGVTLGYNGTIKLKYTTINMINGFDYGSNINIYQTHYASINDVNFINIIDDCIFDNILDESNYKLLDTTNNGRVVIPNTTGTGFNKLTNGYNNGSITFDIQLSNYLPKGIYIIEIIITDDLKYYVAFEKNPSTEARITSMVYNYQEINPGNLSSNESNPALHKYGTILTEDYLKQISSEKENEEGQFFIPEYLDSLDISPLATYNILDASVSKVNNKYIYQIRYEIIAEDMTTKSYFTHYITEEDYETYINKIYKNDGIIEVGPIEKDDNEAYIYETLFSKEDVPAYLFEYNLDNYYFDNPSDFLEVVFIDENDNLLSDEELDKLNVEMNVRILNNGFYILFPEEYASKDYYFRLKYKNSGFFNSEAELSFEVLFDKIKITKEKNTNSYLDNIIFVSENVTSSIKTMIDIDEISLAEYEIMIKDPTREIVSLPSRIFYNQYDYHINKQDEFYVIGLVSKTELEFYSPSFVLPEGATIYRTEKMGDLVYRYIPYTYIDENNEQQESTFLVSEDGQAFLDSAGSMISINGDVNEFIYNDISYTISELAGKQMIEVDNKIHENTTLRCDYNTFGSFDDATEKFNFVNYRVYSEKYSDDNEANLYTDYLISIQDITNNIRFNINIIQENGLDLSTIMYKTFVELICYTDNDDGYILYNRVGFFADFISGEASLNKKNIQSNTSGKYAIKLILPKGYNYSFIVKDCGVEREFTSDDYFIIDPSLTTRTIDLTIEIIEDINQKEWGIEIKYGDLFKN